MPSYMSKYRFARVRISILSSKIYIKAYLNVTSLFVVGTWLASRISLRRPPGARYYFDVRIEIQTLTNLYLDIHEGIPKYASLYVPGQPPQPPAASRCQTLFLIYEF